jgi:cell division protein FtsB
LVIASFFGKNGWIEMYRSKKKQKALLLQMERLQEEKNRLQREIEELERNPRAVEKKARQELWLMDPDEIVIVKEKIKEKKEKDK